MKGSDDIIIYVTWVRICKEALAACFKVLGLHWPVKLEITEYLDVVCTRASVCVQYFQTQVNRYIRSLSKVVKTFWY